ncbi:MAG: hypothetical protein A2114_00070 [Candidatus Vogelbacteria bacterium GWA1_51_14]|uniref:Uncharacterized protein n=1 Tax=Candidatus Vogelbacteria bacterium GWA1_51_14 TaxID=1802435 RepID=A0A1G2Q9I6_9BACT|nr:MAG: hypothetical protein A2114_00070 [Candidatus Vogelbacteria bacterium GWA1_51_14]
MSRLFVYDQTESSDGYSTINEIGNFFQIHDLDLIARWPCSKRFILIELNEDVIPKMFITIKVPIIIEDPEGPTICLETVLLVTFDSWQGIEQYTFPQFHSQRKIDGIQPFLDQAEELGEVLTDNLGLYLASENDPRTFLGTSIIDTQKLMSLERKLN